VHARLCVCARKHALQVPLMLHNAHVPTPAHTCTHTPMSTPAPLYTTLVKNMHTHQSQSHMCMRRTRVRARCFTHTPASTQTFVRTYAAQLCVRHVCNQRVEGSAHLGPVHIYVVGGKADLGRALLRRLQAQLACEGHSDLQAQGIQGRPLGNMWKLSTGESGAEGSITVGKCSLPSKLCLQLARPRT